MYERHPNSYHCLPRPSRWDHPYACIAVSKGHITQVSTWWLVIEQQFGRSAKTAPPWGEYRKEGGVSSRRLKAGGSPHRIFDEIEVGLRHTIEKPDEVLVWVKDQGIGIPTDEMPRIFERFHRARNLERSMSGLGIGLYLVKEIVMRHNGKVWAESSEGNGSTFYVLLPLEPTQH